MAKKSKFQQKVIKNYYDNRDAIALQRVQELVTELYLSEGKKRQQHWKNLETHLTTLGVPASQIEHFITQDSPELVAKCVEQLMAKK